VQGSSIRCNSVELGGRCVMVLLRLVAGRTVRARWISNDLWSRFTFACKLVTVGCKFGASCCVGASSVQQCVPPIKATVPAKTCPRRARTHQHAANKTVASFHAASPNHNHQPQRRRCRRNSHPRPSSLRRLELQIIARISRLYVFPRIGRGGAAVRA